MQIFNAYLYRKFFSRISFIRYYALKNPAIWLGESLGLNTTIETKKVFKSFDEGFIFIKNQGNHSNPLWDISLLRILQFDRLPKHAGVDTEKWFGRW